LPVFISHSATMNWKSDEPTAPTAEPIPTVMATALLGSVSETTVNMLLDQAWCEEAASATSATTIHAVGTPATSPERSQKTDMIGTLPRAAMSRPVLRAKFTVWPRLRRCDEIHPPPTAPKSAMR
jgi:hypothetical protein